MYDSFHEIKQLFKINPKDLIVHDQIYTIPNILWNHKYKKYKQKYIKLKNGGKRIQTWIEQQDTMINLLKNKELDIFWKRSEDENRGLIGWLTWIKHIKNAQDLLKNRLKLNLFLDSLNLEDLIFLNDAENLQIIKKNKLPALTIKQIDQYISDESLKLSYSITNKKIITDHNGNDIYNMQSIGKIFTGMLIILLINDGTIEEKYLNEPIKLDKNIFEQLSPGVIKRLNETTLLDCMTHKSGLKDYMLKYSIAYKDETKIPNPIEPEDFLIYADEDVMPVIGHWYYSNLAIILVALSAKYYYNKKHKQKLSYNDILYKYIIDKIGLRTFSVTRPTYAMYTKDSKYVNASPAGGYWLSCNELRKFGDWLNILCNKNKSTHELLKKYGAEFYHDDIIKHGGTHGPDSHIVTSSSYLIVYLKNNITISIMSVHGKDSHKLYDAMMIFDHHVM